MQKARATLLDDALDELRFLDAQGDARFAGIPKRKTELKIGEFGESFCDGVHAQVKMLRLEAIVQIPEDVTAAMHGAAAAVGGIHAGTEPFEVAAFAAVHHDLEV